MITSWPPYRILIALACCGPLAQAAPWDLTAVTLDQPAAFTTEVGGLHVDQATLRQTKDGPVAELELLVAGASEPIGLMVVAFDAARRPLAAGYEYVAPPKLVGRRTALSSRLSLTIGFGPLPDGESIAYLAAGPMTQVLNYANLLSLASGARVVGQSSSYGGSYEPDRALDDNPRTQWATATGQNRDGWLIVELAGGAVQRLSGIGLNPWGEASYTDCALHHFTLQASITGTAPEDFKTVISDACAYADQLQRFEFEPLEARYLKLLCHDNHGNDRWIELSSFEAYPADVPDTMVNGLAMLLGAFAQTLQPIPTFPRDLVLYGEPRFELDWGFIQPVAPSPQAPLLELVGCKSAQAEWRTETLPDRDLRYLSLSYDFGMLLGGARQLCAAIVAEMSMGKPARLQFDARPEPPTNRLRVVVWDSRNDWFEYGVEGSGQGWQRYWVDLDRPASKRGGAAEPRYPLRRVAIGLAPKGREGSAGSLDIDDPIVMYPAP